ncbi:MAG: flagellar motor stator protein MotA [Rhodospirillales bacterium]|nr:flagellar motor stator protein MotA [Rhodospirillales bacterium]MBT6825831.1 flagellar motor stator protein MotA [Rhodospirillales bacterium]MBT7506229.1 flagellar motor stator protein MotA [Rhodospirillales bacterium]
MLFIVGILIVSVCVIGLYGIHGSYAVLWQPIEFGIIFGGAFGAFVIAYPKKIVIGAFKSIGLMIKGPHYKRDHYNELLCVLYTVFKLAKSKGDLALESHIDKPEESSLFGNFPLFQNDHHGVDFLCDYLRLLTLGANNPHEMETVMDMEIEIHHNENHALTAAMTSAAEALPALGIVAAVLGVIVTMNSITEPPEILGGLIAAALVGTFAGILLSYGFVGPMATSVEKAHAEDADYLNCMKAGLMGHMQGYAPQISVELTRKSLSSTVRPSFAEVEEMVNSL